jgi:hypothetical protein
MSEAADVRLKSAATAYSAKAYAAASATSPLAGLTIHTRFAHGQPDIKEETA